MKSEQTVIPPTKQDDATAPAADAARAGPAAYPSDELAKQTPHSSPARKACGQVPRKDELISESLPESPQKLPQQNELRELERGTPFNCNSPDFSLDISHDREPVESHTPVNSQIHSQMTNQAPPSISPLLLGRADPVSCAVLRMNAKELEGKEEKEARERKEDIQERRSPHQSKSPQVQQSKSRRESQSPQQLSSPRQTKTPQERKSPQEKIQEIQQRTMEELGLLAVGKTVQKSNEAAQVLRQHTEQNQIKPILEEKSQEDDSSMSVRLNVSSLEIEDHSKYIKDVEKHDAKKRSRKNSASQR